MPAAVSKQKYTSTAIIEFKSMKTEIWHLKRNKCKAERDCESTVRKMQQSIKADSREMHKELVRARQSNDSAVLQVRRMANDTKYLRKRATLMDKENVALRQELETTTKRLRDIQGGWAKLEKAASKADASCAKATRAYRDSACTVRDLRKQCSAHDKQVNMLERLAQTAASMADQEQERASELVDANISLNGKLDKAVERADMAEERAWLAQDQIAELELLRDAHALTGDALLSERTVAEQKLSVTSTALLCARQQLDDLEDRIKKLQPPQYSRIGLGEADRSARRYVQGDVDFLHGIFSERPWRADDVVKALNKSGILAEVFDTSEVWNMRLKWIREEMKKLSETRWSLEKTIGLMIDGVMSYGDLQQLRSALSLDYSAEHDRCMHNIWLQNPHDKTLHGELLTQKKLFVRVPQPIPPVELVRKKFKEFESSLKIKVSEDGRIATHRFKDKLIEMFMEHRSLGLIKPGCGRSKDNCFWVVYTMDGFPVEALSVEHAGIFCANLAVPSQSEEFFRIVTCATIKETNAELNRMHSVRGIHKDFNAMNTKGSVDYTDTQGTETIHTKLFVCADKKAVENLRGSCPGCAWCCCGKEKRLSAAWPLNSQDPVSWTEAEKRLCKVCSGAFPDIFQVYSWAHLALPHEKLPRYCSVCKKKPYKDEAEYEAYIRTVAALRADQSKEGKAKWRAYRSAHALHHFGQYLHEAPNILFNMIQCIPEIMHLDGLNIAKQAWTKGVLVLLNEHMRDVLTGFFKGLGAKLDVKTKPDGRAGSAWFKASQWAELVCGSDNIPGGLAPWFASLLYFIGLDFVSKQKAFVPQEAEAGATAEEVMRQAFGLKGQQLLDCARLYDAYKDWHDATHMATPDDATREAVALRLAITANRLMVAFKVVAKESGKTWVYHIALYIVPRTVRKCARPQLCEHLTVTIASCLLTPVPTSSSAGGEICGHSQPQSWSHEASA